MMPDDLVTRATEIMGELEKTTKLIAAFSNAKAEFLAEIRSVIEELLVPNAGDYADAVLNDNKFSNGLYGVYKEPAAGVNSEQNQCIADALLELAARINV